MRDGAVPAVKAMSERYDALGNFPDYKTGPMKQHAVDVQFTLGAELTRFVGPFDFTGKIALTRELNRYLENDATNANFALGIRQAF